MSNTTSNRANSPSCFKTVLSFQVCYVSLNPRRKSTTNKTARELKSGANSTTTNTIKRLKRIQNNAKSRRTKPISNNKSSNLMHLSHKRAVCEPTFENHAKKQAGKTFVVSSRGGADASCKCVCVCVIRIMGDSTY